MLFHPTRVLLLLAVLSWHQALTAAVIRLPDITVRPNNDNHSGESNLNSYRAGTLWLGVEGWAGKSFDIDDSGGTTEYEFTVPVDNRSGVDWLGYKFWLGLGVGPNDSTVLSPPGDGFDFDVGATGDRLPDCGCALQLASTEDALHWSGVFADGASVTFSFSIDVPDGLGVTRIWLFEQPTLIPEPSTFALLAAGLAGMGWSRYRSAGRQQFLRPEPGPSDPERVSPGHPQKPDVTGSAP